MGLFDRMYSIKNQETTQQYDEGCSRCGKLQFDYDSYFDEYACVDCGWTMSEKPNGEIEINKKNVAASDGQPPNEAKDEFESQDMPLEEMNEIVQEYGSAMINCGPPPGGVADVSKLPYPKSKIKKAVIQALQLADDPIMATSLKGGYTQLSEWQEGVGDANIGLNLSTFGVNMDTSEREKAFLERQSQMKEWKDKVNSEFDSLRADLLKRGLWEE
ncbi:MAG: hypothetical protein HKP41_06685 [Desulfobacterales bacterium]|nr:hypothetical protein [Deltaproteobacteria bacterium]NNK94020.1 hypothetical protein [Desulfobacterales bacterium]